MANVNGRYRGFRTSRIKADWDTFDSLPRPIRDALNDATTLWNAGWCAKKLREGMSVASVVNAIHGADQKLQTTTRDEQDATSFLADLGL